MRRIAQAGLALAMLFSSLSIPLAAFALTPAWYMQNCDWHGRCEAFHLPTAERHVHNFSDFLLYKDSLKGFWSDKEKRHLAEVRDIYSVAAAAAIVMMLAVVVVYVRWPGILASASMHALIMLVVTAVLVFPVFGFVWRDVFHAALFDNRDWVTSHTDVTWYITPREFFRNTILGMCVCSASILASTVFIARNRVTNSS
ncbi:MAG: DUF1461 domain-containing protein [Pseudomonadota bacterium]